MATKDKIIEEALTLFSKRGFGAVTVDEIAKAVGIKAPSLYKHYQSKQDIFDAIVHLMKQRYIQQMSQFNMNGMDSQEDYPAFSKMRIEAILQLGKSLFSYYIHDDFNKKFRKMLVITQFDDESMRKMYMSQYFDDPLQYQSRLFESMIPSDKRKEYDCRTIALHFYAPIQFLISLCDAQPEREQDALKMLEEHIKQFSVLYGLGNEHE